MSVHLLATYIMRCCLNWELRRRVLYVTLYVTWTVSHVFIYQPIAPSHCCWVHWLNSVRQGSIWRGLEFFRIYLWRRCQWDIAKQPLTHKCYCLCTPKVFPFLFLNSVYAHICKTYVAPAVWHSSHLGRVKVVHNDSPIPISHVVMGSAFVVPIPGPK